MSRFEVKRHKGTTFLFVDGNPVPPILAYVSPRYCADFKRAGINIVTWPVPIGWVGPAGYDYAETYRVLGEFISVNPEILILPRISFPGVNNDWWCKQHPEEMVKLSNGETGSSHSTASEIWRKEAGEALLRFIMHVEDSEYADSVIGYHVCDGHFNEWFAWDSANFERDVHRLRYVCGAGFDVKNCPTPWPDYSRPMTEAFRRWLRVKYRGDVEALRKAWRDPDVGFSTASIPSRMERAWSDEFLIRDPSRSMRPIDYDMCYQDVHSETLLELCRVAKEEAGSERLVGVFYGYVWTGFFRGFYMQNAGHLALSKVLESPYVDFIASPYDYENRGVGGVTFSQSLPESVTLHGKLFFTELDPKTFLTDPAMKWHHKGHLKPQTLEETVEVLKRDYSYAHAMGIGMWWMDLFNQGWYHHDGIIRAVRRLGEIEKRMMDLDHSSNREIAVILDEKSLLYERPCQNLAASLRSVQRQWELAYVGAPFDTYLQSDLVTREIKEYKMYLFLNNVHVTREEAEKIKEIVRREGKVAVWVWASGLILDDEISTGNIWDLTGISVECERVEARLHIDVTNYDHPITRDLQMGSCFGPELSRWHTVLFKESGFIEDDPAFTIGPVFYSADSEATVLGRISANGKPGFVVKEFDDWISVYISAPMLPKDILRNIARLAGVHIYLESGDLVYANGHFLSVYPRLSGKKKISLPETRTVTDLWRDRQVAEDVNRLEVEMEANRAYMYLLE